MCVDTYVGVGGDGDREAVGGGDRGGGWGGGGSVQCWCVLLPMQDTLSG